MFERTLAATLHDTILAASADAGFTPRIVHHAPQKPSAMMLVAGGAGITFVPASMRGIQDSALVLATLTGLQPVAALRLATRNGGQAVLVERFRATVRKQAKLFDHGRSVEHRTGYIAYIERHARREPMWGTLARRLDARGLCQPSAQRDGPSAAAPIPTVPIDAT